jgi:exodeoxyribonuclease VII large subunit
VVPRAQLPREAARLREHGRRAVLSRARLLSTLTRAPAAHLERQRARLHQQLREIRAGSRRRIADERGVGGRRALVLKRKADSTLIDCRKRRPGELQRLALALAGHDPQRTLERGYALVESPAGEPLTSAARAREAEQVRLRFADGAVPARVQKR